MAALSRIANGEHRDLKIMPGDTVVFSSSAIPGNGIMISRVVNLLTRCGADVITNSILNDIHSSGHPAKQELRLLLKLVKPKYFMPMHGEYRMLSIHGDLAVSLGMPKENVFIYNLRIVDLPVDACGRGGAAAPSGRFLKKAPQKLLWRSLFAVWANTATLI